MRAQYNGIHAKNLQGLKRNNFDLKQYRMNDTFSRYYNFLDTQANVRLPMRFLIGRHIEDTYSLIATRQSFFACAPKVGNPESPHGATLAWSSHSSMKCAVLKI